LKSPRESSGGFLSDGTIYQVFSNTSMNIGYIHIIIHLFWQEGKIKGYGGGSDLK
jgi:hypothetical protein